MSLPRGEILGGAIPRSDVEVSEKMAEKRVKFSANSDNQNNHQNGEKEDKERSDKVRGSSASLSSLIRYRAFIISFFDRLRHRCSLSSSSAIPVTPLIPEKPNPINNVNRRTMNKVGRRHNNAAFSSSISRASSGSQATSIFNTAAVRSSAPNSSSKLSPSTPQSSTATYPYGNIIKSGTTDFKPETTPPKPATTTLGTNKTAAYGYGSVVWAEMQMKQKMKEAQEFLKLGLIQLKNARWREAFELFDKAVDLAPGIINYRVHRAEALARLGELEEAVKELENVLQIEPHCDLAHLTLANVFLRLGQIENARRHTYATRQHQPEQEKKLEEIGKHLRLCAEARKVGDWRKAMKEADAAAHAGADSSPQLLACKVEAILKLNQMYDGKINLPDMTKYSPVTASSSQMMFFGMFSEGYYCFVLAKSEMAHGRFQEAIKAAKKASGINPENPEIRSQLEMLKKMDSIRTCANEHYIAGRYNEALNVYSECLRFDQRNPVVYCNKAACWIKMGEWELAIGDCSRALRTNPKYVKALLRRAFANSRLGRWAEAVADYEVLKMELPKDKEIAEFLRNARTELMNLQRRKFDGKTDRMSHSGPNHFRTATSCGSN